MRALVVFVVLMSVGVGNVAGQDVFGRLGVEPMWRGGRLAGLYQMSAELLAADGL